MASSNAKARTVNQHLNWLKILERNKAVSVDNLRRALKNSTHADDISELESELNRRLRKQNLAKRSKAQSDSRLLHSNFVEIRPNSPVLDEFKKHLPPKPYCANDLSAGLQIRPLQTALQRAYIQQNGPGMVWSLVFDIDKPCINQQTGQSVWEAAGLPVPNLIVMNEKTGRGHLIYHLKAGVCTTEQAHIKPLRYLAAIQRAYTLALGADSGYAGLICKNPYNKCWHLLEKHDATFDLGDLARYVNLKSKAVKLPSDASESFGLGRNVTMFHTGRKWAYRAVREYWAPNGVSKWSEAVLERLLTLNGEFPQPLPFVEVKATAKSISGWTWRRMTPAGLQDLIQRTHTPEQQAERGRKGGLASGEARRASREADKAAAKLMRAQGHTQLAIAVVLGVHRNTVSAWLSDA
ncbi:replication initiation protein [Acidithiobacillus thiooxidans]|uniref:Primase C-terminal 1 domain-containing protein n=1 Tax=Acidithiobacillus thiooxidans ATCC 19377 TaxID=637390 RepID=A0A543PYK3_ACITH|nr:replication initiation protein [Acidithiobacillus thiooxidans]MDX5936793.1 replication initiation protein [Acidithiobacillus thiooxidans]MDX5936802.1 replication initiation protein [Acidithiobacillus thiooxidans]MDX5936811.1 replication initiation protein [Acidithiobacillus thiooxidans]TQN49155.1 hypothetical protein DLNHIDIE_03534 [Acidithiobacillus thiooxidans ATCC 19377]